MAPCPQHLLTTTSPQRVVAFALTCLWRNVSRPSRVQKEPWGRGYNGHALFRRYCSQVWFGVCLLVLIFEALSYYSQTGLELFPGLKWVPSLWILALQAHSYSQTVRTVSRARSSKYANDTNILKKQYVSLQRDMILTRRGRGDLRVVMWWGVWTSPSPQQREHQKCAVLCPPTYVIVKAVGVYNTSSRIVKSRYEEFLVYFV